MYAYILLFALFFTQPLYCMLTVLKNIKPLPKIGAKRAMLFRDYPNLHHLPPVIQDACEKKLQQITEKNYGPYNPPTHQACDKLNNTLHEALNTKKRLFINRFDYCRYIITNPWKIRFSNWCENMEPRHSLAVGLVISAAAWRLHCDPVFLFNTFFVTPPIVMEHDSRMYTKKALEHLLSAESPEVRKEEYKNFSAFIHELRNKQDKLEKE